MWENVPKFTRGRAKAAAAHKLYVKIHALYDAQPEGCVEHAFLSDFPFVALPHRLRPASRGPCSTKMYRPPSSPFSTLSVFQVRPRDAFLLSFSVFRPASRSMLLLRSRPINY